MKVWIVEKKRSNGAWTPIGLSEAPVWSVGTHDSPRAASEARAEISDKGYAGPLRVALYERKRARRKGGE